MDKLVRVNELAGPSGILPISKSTWWSGVKKGHYPQPIKLGPNVTAWRLSDIEALIQNGINCE